MEYKRLFLTYPRKGTKIHKTKSLSRGIRKCYEEFKEFNDEDIGEGSFVVTDLNDNCEYKFKIKNKKIYHVRQNNTNYQKGGYQDPDPELKQDQDLTNGGALKIQNEDLTKKSIYTKNIEMPIGKQTWGAKFDLYKPDKKKTITPVDTPIITGVAASVSPKKIIFEKSYNSNTDHKEIIKKLDQLSNKIEKVDKKLIELNEDKKTDAKNGWCIFM